jgi:helicase
MGRPTNMGSDIGTALVTALRDGSPDTIAQLEATVSEQTRAALSIGPQEWVAARLLQQLLRRFRVSNIRAVLPNGWGDFWNPLVTSFLVRPQPVWEFFPSQIQAFDRGLLTRDDTFSLQMPTGAGKTALCETLLYAHTRQVATSVGVLLVPFRSLASELRETLVQRLNAMGVSARAAYGGTVPTGDEVRDLDDVRVMVATPEALSGVLSADPAFFRRISLVICDEGHLLDSGERGIGLELLLARMRARDGRPPRFVFVSAIVPNIEEINAWLGGTVDSVVRSDYRPAPAEFAVLRGRGTGARRSVDLDMHPHEAPPTRFSIPRFLSPDDFRWFNAVTRRQNTYPFNTIKTQAIAAARKALAMGPAAVFAANKSGQQGATGLAEELLEQLRLGLPLPEPSAYVDPQPLAQAMEYVESEYSLSWLGTQLLQFGAILHHGDIPQETREVLEGLLRRRQVRLAICTGTLAEGVNLPIRTLVLYSVQRRRKDQPAETLLSRDIKNLVGRAGRPGSTTKGLVVCANAEQWPTVERVAREAPAERVAGALRLLVQNLQAFLARRNLALTNELLENSPLLYSLIDGVDATLIDLAAEEIGEDALLEAAAGLADRTFASQQATTEASRRLLRTVFTLRANRMIAARAAGRLTWLRETGARARMLDAVETQLLPSRAQWDDLADPVDPALVDTVLQWAWRQRELPPVVREAYRLGDDVATDTVRPSFFSVVSAWLSGQPYAEMARQVNLELDVLLRIHARAVSFVLQTLVEQAIPLLQKFLEAQGRVAAVAVLRLPEHLRFGVPTDAARALAAFGVRHRKAAVALGAEWPTRAGIDDRLLVFRIARQLLLDDREEWRTRLGHLVFSNTLTDVS